MGSAAVQAAWTNVQCHVKTGAPILHETCMLQRAVHKEHQIGTVAMATWNALERYGSVSFVFVGPASLVSCIFHLCAVQDRLHVVLHVLCR